VVYGHSGWVERCRLVTVEALLGGPFGWVTNALYDHVVTLGVVPGLFVVPALSWLFLYARAKQYTAAWERRHPVVSKLVLMFAIWCAAAGVVMMMVAALVVWINLGRSAGAAWTWAIGLAAVFSIGFVGERLSLRLANRGLSARRPNGRLRLVALLAWPCGVAVINGPAAVVGIVAIEAAVLIGIFVARVSDRPDPLASAS
jgi:hypothetical protein